MDVAIYDTFARMSQAWINNIPEVDWHGLNGNLIIGNAPANQRYTEARLSKATEDGMLNGIKKGAVNMIPNFSEDDEWPEVLPALMPRLMVNGSQGIGVTIANVWVPHNLTEVTQVIVKYIQDKVLDYSNLYPDFPSGGIIINKEEISNIYKTGKGRVTLRGRADIKGKSLFITELPYQVFVEPFIESIKELVEKEELTGIKDIYNKTDKKKLLIEIVCDNPSALLNALYAKTDLQKTFSPNQFALVSKTPKLLTLQNYLDIYVAHNIECLRREFGYDLKKAADRLEIIEGMLKALEDIDNVISLIKTSKSASDAVIALIKTYNFTERQAQAIVDMRLGKLANLEQIELNEEKVGLTSTINKLTELLSSNDNISAVLVERLQAFTKTYGTPRKTEVAQITITKEEKEIANVEPEKCVVIMTESGLIKRVPSSSFRTQRRNGKGVKSADDVISCVIRTNTIDSLMVFSTQGQMYRLLVNDIPVGTNTSQGVSIKTLVTMNANEEASTIYSIYRDTEAKYVFFTTKSGIVKKTSLDEYIKTKKKSGIAAINLREGDEIASVSLVDKENILLITEQGMCIKFDSMSVGATSRTTVGIKGINLNEGDKVVCALPIRDEKDSLAIFTKAGLGKKVGLTEFPLQGRGGKGLVCYKPSGETGTVAGAALISDEDDLLVAGSPSSICVSAKDVPLMGRGAIGNQIIKGSRISSVSKI